MTRLVFGYPPSGGPALLTTAVAAADPFGTFHNADNLFPAAGWAPFAVNAWPNLALGASPTVDGNNTAYVTTVTVAATAAMFQDKDCGGGSGDTDYQHPVYWAKASDPLYTYDPVDSSSSGYHASFLLSGTTFRMPVGCKPARGAGGSFNSGDNHVIVVDQTTGKCYCFWKVQTGFIIGGDPGTGYGIDDTGHRIGSEAIGIYSSFNKVGDARLPGGAGGVNGDDANAAITNLYLGQIRGVELAANYIGHPLSVNAQKCSSTIAPVYPAQGNGTQAAGWPPMGQFWRITLSSAAIEALSCPTWQKTILHCLADFGAYVDDTGANAGYAFDLRFESPQSYKAFSLTDPVATYAAAHLDGGATITDRGAGLYSYKLNTTVFNNAVKNNIQFIDPTYIQSGR